MEKMSSYEYLKSILTYTFNGDEAVINVLKKFYPIYFAEVIADLYALPYFLQVIDPARLSTHTEDEIETLAYLNKEVGIHIFFTTKPDEKIILHFTQNQFTVIEGFDNQRIELEALNVKNKARKLEKKRRAYENLFARRMIIELRGLNGEKTLSR